MPNHRKEYPEAIKMYEAGLSLADIAAFYGITRQSIWAWMKRRHVRMRPNLRFSTENHFHRGTRADKRAIHIVEKAIKKGLLTRPPVCQSCGGTATFSNGRTGIEAHHADYSKPLDVTWLCQRCHHHLHRTFKASR